MARLALSSCPQTTRCTSRAKSLIVSTSQDSQVLCFVLTSKAPNKAHAQCCMGLRSRGAWSAGADGEFHMATSDNINTVIMIALVIATEQQPWHFKTNDSAPVITFSSRRCRRFFFSLLSQICKTPFYCTGALISKCHDQHVADMCCIFKTDEQWCRLEVVDEILEKWLFGESRLFPLTGLNSFWLKSLKSTTATLMLADNASAPGFNGYVASFKAHAG